MNEATLETKLTFNSIYFPTNLPTVTDPQGGLVPSQQRRLDEIVTNFKQYLTVRPEANLILEAHADLRGSVAFNQGTVTTPRRLGEELSGRARRFLPRRLDHGLRKGKEPYRTKRSKTLTAQNPNVTPEERKRVDSNIVAFRMANNRRVDLRLAPRAQTSQQLLPLQLRRPECAAGRKETRCQEGPHQEVISAGPRRDQHPGEVFVVLRT